MKVRHIGLMNFIELRDTSSKHSMPTPGTMPQGEKLGSVVSGLQY